MRISDSSGRYGLRHRCVSWLVACEGYGLLEAVDMVQTKRGTILSNHGCLEQLV